ncbi:MAG: inorganic diphosphatase [Gammaproteobacteria bacterium]|nr:inorganic diphosphatase [Gammaproteobacteria bacterium]
MSKLYDDNQQPAGLYDGLLGQITHFFEQYKALESGKWVKVENWLGAEQTHQEILISIERYNRMGMK